MTDSAADPYLILGIPEDASDATLRSAYRRLVQVHHPDHNNGSAESARRFEAIQAAYAQVVAERRLAGEASGGDASDANDATEADASAGAAGGGGRGSGSSPLHGTPYGSHAVSSRVAAMEREIRERKQAEQRAREAAARATVDEGPRKPTPEELGYVTTDDSFGRIFDDARDALTKRWSKSRGQSFADRLADLFNEGD
jgi:DnaJ-class molecular chaperone